MNKNFSVFWTIFFLFFFHSGEYQTIALSLIERTVFKESITYKYHKIMFLKLQRHWDGKNRFIE